MTRTFTKKLPKSPNDFFLNLQNDPNFYNKIIKMTSSFSFFRIRWNFHSTVVRLRYWTVFGNFIPTTWLVPRNNEIEKSQGLPIVTKHSVTCMHQLIYMVLESRTEWKIVHLLYNFSPNNHQGNPPEFLPKNHQNHYFTRKSSENRHFWRRQI